MTKLPKSPKQLSRLTAQEKQASQVDAAQALKLIRAQRWEQELLTRLRYAPKQVSEDGRGWVFKRG